MERINIPFKGWDLVAWINKHDGDHMIAIRPIAEAIGVEWKRQEKKIKANPAFSVGVHMYPGSKDGKVREMLCLPVKQLNGWLYGINSNRVKPEIREKLLDFQEECHIKLHDYFSGKDQAAFDKKDERITILEDLVIGLHETIKTLGKSVLEMSKELRSIKKAQAEADQVDAEMAGKYLARSRKTKGTRALVH